MNTEASGAGAPKCKLCGENHWLRIGCDGQAQGRHAAKNTPPPRAAIPGRTASAALEGTSPPGRNRLAAQPARAAGSAECKTSSKKKRRRAKKRAGKKHP